MTIVFQVNKSVEVSSYPLQLTINFVVITYYFHEYATHGFTVYSQTSIIRGTWAY